MPLLILPKTSRPQLAPWLAGVFVKPQCRGKGIGSELVRRIEAEARSLGVSTLYLYTPHTESLYERLGWSVTERCEYRNTNVVVMSKELARVYNDAGNAVETHKQGGVTLKSGERISKTVPGRTAIGRSLQRNCWP
jgi:predicted N-acetyltransferase YhbS